MAKLDGEALLEQIQTFNNEFDQLIQDRHEIGMEKYGALKFLEADTMNEALFELADLSNYARYTFIRIRLWMMNSEAYQLDGNYTFGETDAGDQETGNAGTTFTPVPEEG